MVLVDGEQHRAIYRIVPSGQVFFIDQRRLAHIFVIICLKTVDEFVITIRNMIVGRRQLLV